MLECVLQALKENFGIFQPKSKFLKNYIYTSISLKLTPAWSLASLKETMKRHRARHLNSKTLHNMA